MIEHKHLMIVGIIIGVLGLVSGYKNINPVWYAVFAIGLFMFLYHYNQHYFHHQISVRDAFGMYLFYLLAGIVFEIAGIDLGLWSYPAYNNVTYYFNVLIIGYPLILFMVYELFAFFMYSFAFFAKNYWITFFVTAFVATFIKEFPHVIYGVKEYYGNVVYSLFGIDVFVYIGWIAMTAFALLPREREV